MPNPAGDLAAIYPNLSATNSAASSALSRELAGALSPDTINLINNQAAEWGTGNGMPGFQPGSLFWNRSLRDIGRTSEGQIQQGLRDYPSILGAASSTQTVNPNLQTEIRATNATNAAAPDPAAAGTYAQQLFDKYLQQLRGPAGGTGGASGGTPWYLQGKQGQSWITPGAAGGGRGDVTPGGAGGYWA